MAIKEMKFYDTKKHALHTSAQHAPPQTHTRDVAPLPLSASAAGRGGATVHMQLDMYTGKIAIACTDTKIRKSAIEHGANIPCAPTRMKSFP